MSLSSTSSATSNISTRSRCLHGSYGPTCMCYVNSADMISSAPLPTPSTSATQATVTKTPESTTKTNTTTSLGDQIRAILGIKAHKRCNHGSYGPTCTCDLKVDA